MQPLSTTRPPEPRPLLAPKSRGARPAQHVLLGVGVATLLVGCGNGGDAPSVLDPQSDAAQRVEGLWWLTFAISTAVVIVVIAFIVVAVRRGRGVTGDEIDRRPVSWGDRFIVIAGLVVSGAILAGTFVVSLGLLDALADPPEPPALTIDVVARNWWWEIRYPNGGVTANEIHIPAGRPVELRLIAADVIHSFWVPQLNVKKDHVPGMDNRMWIMADRPGRYRGQCAEFCGLQHARMAFYVEADPPEEFDAWLAMQARPAQEPATPLARTGRDIFAASSCAGCHTIRGVTRVAELGPDLTHLASRQTIAAGTLSLTRETLTAFSHNAQVAKPGVTMPPTELTPDQMAAVVEYLMGLE